MTFVFKREIVRSAFSFCIGVFKRLVLQTGKHNGLFGKGLNSNVNFFLQNKTDTFRENDVRHMEFVTGLKIAAVQNSPFCHNRLVGQVREILQNVQVYQCSYSEW